MRKIVCSCDAGFEADLPDSIDLDERDDLRKALLDGSFMTVVCPSCGRKLKPELQLSVFWPSRRAEFLVVPELDAGEAGERSARRPEADLLIGYPELAERVSVLWEGLDPMTVEALKYYLLLKASEADPDAEPSAWFYGVGDGTIDFHVHGLRPGEVAASRIPRALYEKTLAESRARPDAEPFRSLRKKNRLSVRNLFETEE